jgi:hypothetical protein
VGLAELVLTPIEGFVLSRVDGATTYDDICRLCGLPTETTLEILRKLRRHGIIREAASAPARAPAALSAPAAIPAPVPAAVGTPAPQVSLLELHDDGSPVDPALLAEAPGFDVLTKARIVRLHRRLASLEPWQLLGVVPGDVAGAKRAYFAASKQVHPDRYYGEDLGPYRAWLADIFSALTHAFDRCRA